MTKKVLILGASQHQIPSIEAALSCGYEVHVTDNQPSNPGHKLATFSYNVDTTDSEKIVELCRAIEIDAILSPCTDVAVLTASIVSKEMSLLGVPPTASNILTSKIEFREFQKKMKLPHPKFWSGKFDLLELGSFAGKLVVKPDRCSGSRGISIIDPKKVKLDEYIDYAVHESLNSKVLCEEQIEGHHGTLEGAICNGKITLNIFLDRQIPNSEQPRTIGHRLPSVLSANQRNSVISQVQKIFDQLLIKDSMFDVDFIVSSEEVHILEMSPRLGGNSISRLVEISTGINLPMVGLNMALGVKNISLDKAAIMKPAAVVLLGSNGSGYLTINKEKIKSIKKLPGVVEFKIFAEAGSKVQPFVTGRNVLAAVFIRTNNTSELCELENTIRKIEVFEV